jgi:hypothetical protein
MKKNTTTGLTGFAMLILFLISNSNLNARAIARYGQHPAYLHALSDLRAARWLIEHKPGNWKATEEEMGAVNEIDKAIEELKKASIDDGKDINFHPKVDEKADHPGRIHESLQYLQKAKSDVNEEEDNKFAQNLNVKIFNHIGKAIEFAEKAKKLVH